MERQITHAAHGHVLTNANVWSPDSRWIVYDIRSDPAGEAFDGTRIERVHAETGEVQVLYESRHGAHCGVPSCSPIDDRVAFILGPEHPTPDWQYAPYHRRGAIVDARRPGAIENLDAGNFAPQFTPGALRGGSHVHVFSGDGQWVSFTYEDHVLATHPCRQVSPRLAAGLGETGPHGNAASLGETCPHIDLNQRNVGVATSGGPVQPPPTHPRNHDGQFFSVLATKTVNQPQPGSDEISRAYEDAWVGAHGYRRTDGRWQCPALAFLGDVMDSQGKQFTELFIVDIPDAVTKPGDGPLEGTPTHRPAPPAGACQRRLTFTADRLHPGVQGPRHWPRSSPDGAQIAFLMRDDAGVVQLWTVSPNGGVSRKITADPWDVASAFSWGPYGTQIAYIADGSVMTVDVASGKSTRATIPRDRGRESFATGGPTLRQTFQSQKTPDPVGADQPRPEACVFSPDGRRIAIVRQVSSPQGRFNQICVVDL